MLSVGMLCSKYNYIMYLGTYLPNDCNIYYMESNKIIKYR